MFSITLWLCGVLLFVTSVTIRCKGMEISPKKTLLGYCRIAGFSHVGDFIIFFKV